MSTVAISNETTVLTDAQVHQCMAALQAQVTEDLYCSPWGIDAQLYFLPKGQSPKPGEYQLVFCDNSDQAGALGYHETTVNGDPIGYAFVKTCMEDGESWSLCASHELLEMLIDPDIQTAEEQDNGAGTITLRMKEICDPVESAYYGYVKGGMLVSDFILPAWFDSTAPKGTLFFDHQGHCTEPLQVLSHGYIGVLYATTAGWTQLQADGTPGGKEAQSLNRRGRRGLPDAQWKRSER